ncbi:MAG: hypothetical protein PF517_05085 [Salinivirgaceae bacterium]|jgi:hypothetical protein|nr:hypothetical protein [Salinivirgaceae bacterium]
MKLLQKNTTKAIKLLVLFFFIKDKKTTKPNNHTKEYDEYLELYTKTTRWQTV